MDKIYYENENLFKPVYQTALALIKERGNNHIYDIMQSANYEIVNTEYDNWNGGTYGYTLYINIPVKRYSLIGDEQISKYEKILSDTLNEVIRGENNHYFSVLISPILSKSDIEWDLIGGEKGKSELKRKIETVKQIMISVATGGPRINDEDSRYKQLQLEVKQACSKLNIIYNNDFVGLWDWYGKWKADIDTYQGRRDYINNLFAETLKYFDADSETINANTFVQLDDWERLNRTILKIKKSSAVAQNEEDFQSLGLLCRESIISLAQAVYNPSVHGECDDNGIVISNTDSVRMIGNYIAFKLAGKDNEEIRTYAKSTNKLANMLTHKRNATKKDMLLATSATFALVNLIGILQGKY